MGRKKSKNAKLKWQVVKDIVVILGISLFISAVCGVFYFKQVVCKQQISDERAKQEQLCNQLTFMIEDMEQYAQSILVDEQLQKFLQETVESEYEKRRKYDQISKRLMFYSNLRSYIYNTSLVTSDGICYESNYRDQKTDIFEQKKEKMYFKEKFKETGSLFSEEYAVSVGNSDTKMICYRMPLFDPYEYGRQAGTLYMEIYLDYFLGQMEQYGEAYENICLTDKEGMVLYEKDQDYMIQNFMKKEDGDIEKKEKTEEKKNYEMEEGYLLCTEIEPAGWKICTVLPKSEIWRSSRFVLNFFLLSFLFSLGMVILFSSKMMERIVRPVVRLSEQMEKENYGNLEQIQIVRTGDEIETLYKCYCSMIEKIQEEERVRMEQEKKKKEMEFAIMHSQIAPHYLYNVLNTVMFLAATEKNKKIVDIVRALICTLQETLDIGSDQVETSVEKEIKLVEAYLDIQKYRYGGRFESKILCEENLNGYIIPKTIIQPLVENALVHGILPAERKGMVLVRVSKAEEKIVIEVEDDGIGIQESYLQERETESQNVPKKDGRRHIGIQNVRERIRYLYGDSYGMKIERREGGGTKIVLDLPLKERGDIK